MSKQRSNYKMIFLFGIITSCLCCNGQVKSESTKPIPQKTKIGQKVLTLDNSIWSILQDQNNNYWFGTNGKGVYHYTGEALIKYTSQDGLAGDQIRNILEDKLGNIYFDTPNGVSKFDGKSFKTLVAVSSPDNVWKNEPDDLWFKINGDINGVFRYDGKTLFHLQLPKQDLDKGFGMKFEKESRYSPYGLYSTYKDSKGNLWFGTLIAGVFRYDGNSFLWIAEKELTKFDDGRAPGVRSIIEDKDGKFWLSNMLSRYEILESNSGKTTYQKSEGVKAAVLHQQLDLPYFMSSVRDDQNNDLWMLTYSEGVWRYDGKNLEQFLIKEGDTELHLICLYKDKQGVLWIGTQNAGVYKFNGDKFERFDL